MGVALAVGDPSLQQVPGPIVRQVAALAKAPQVAQPVVGRVMVEMRRGQDDAGRVLPDHVFEVRPASRATAPVAPRAKPGIEPAPVRQAAEIQAVRSSAALAFAARALEPHAAAQLRPVAGI